VRRLRTPPTAGVAVALVLMAGAAGCGSSSSQGGAPESGTGPHTSGTATGSPGQNVLSAQEIAHTAHALPQRSTKALPPTRLADGLTPPTNRWFSGLVFGDAPNPVFPLPLAFSLDKTGFGFGLPQVVASATSVVGSHQNDVAVTVPGVADQIVSAYDDASFTLSSRDSSGHELGRTVVAEGSPFIGHTATRSERLHTSVTWQQQGSDRVWTTTTSTGDYALKVTGGTVSGTDVSLDSGGTATFFPVPKGHDASGLAALAAPVSATRTTYDVGQRQVTTSLSYGRGDTAFVATPAQVAGLGDGISCDLGSFPSVYGDLRVCHGPALSWSVPRATASAGLDLSGLSSSDRKTLATQVAQDVAQSPAAPADTYFGGKWLYRQAQLLDLADQVGADQAAATAQTRLVQALSQWTQVGGCRSRGDRCFVYDPRWHGVVGQTPSFGSDEFNDHHFHYGYFLYAAGVLATHDPSVVGRLRPVMDLLAADIAGGRDTGITPRLRVFDVYAGHSWASGTSPFADGNNQESSSEAVNAWAGLSLWASATKNKRLGLEAAWLLSSEASSARRDWTEPAVPSGFDHHVFGINWGGKRDYATWFSPAPSAILGIQLIPMSPSSSYLAGDPGRIATNVREVTDASGFHGPLGDYVLMYSALAGGSAAESALHTAEQQPADAIDDADSRSYLLAFLMSHR
jgi:endo-1,3(4)-beta-glucanase